MKTVVQIGKLFKDKNLFNQALTHKSWVNENKNQRETNERLEFLGDAVLEFVVSSELYSHFPDKEEGYLTPFRANLVNTVNLGNYAKEIGLGQALFLSKGEEDGGGRENISILADTVEAIIGALYLDRGIAVVSTFIQEALLKDLDQKVQAPLKDAKSTFQEQVQAEGKETPKYKILQEDGPDHSKTFQVAVFVEKEQIASAFGKSKSEAEQNAAQKALAQKSRQQV